MDGLLRNTSPWFFKHLFTLPVWVQPTNPCKIWQWFQCILPTYVSLREHFMWMPQNTFNDKSTMVQMMDYKQLPTLMLIQFYIAIWHHWTRISWQHIDGLVQVGSNSIANVLESPRSCTEPSIYIFVFSLQNKSSISWPRIDYSTSYMQT